jgi:phage baseplate assembly protein V
MNHIKNQMRLAAEMAQSHIAKTRYGIIDSYDPGAYACRVRLQPDNTLTGWLPLPSIWVGNGWGLFSPPSIGDLASVEFTEGDIDSGFTGLRFYSDIDRPLPVPAGEFWLVHKLGQTFKLYNTGKAEFSDGHGAIITLNGDGTITSAATTWTHTGNINMTGTITATVDVIGGGKSLKNHVHSGVQSGASNTGAPV